MYLYYYLFITNIMYDVRKYLNECDKFAYTKLGNKYFFVYFAYLSCVQINGIDYTFIIQLKEV